MEEEDAVSSILFLKKKVVFLAGDKKLDIQNIGSGKRSSFILIIFTSEKKSVNLTLPFLKKICRFDISIYTFDERICAAFEV